FCGHEDLSPGPRIGRGMETAARPTRLRVHHILGGTRLRVAPCGVAPACGIDLSKFVGEIDRRPRVGLRN
ncbi:MAG: hypothetical protein ABSH17_12310, partial [Syntrophobacteraceae bacterium]